MTREIIGTIAIALVAVIATLIYFSNRSVRRAQEAQLPKPEDAELGEHPFEAFYVSTVFAAKTLTRVWAHGLGSRGKAKVAVSSTGVSIQRVGEIGFLIPAQSMVSVARASATIDKGVERDGLLVLIWQLGDEQLATHLRIVDSRIRRELESLIIEATGVENE